MLSAEQQAREERSQVVDLFADLDTLDIVLLLRAYGERVREASEDVVLSALIAILCSRYPEVDRAFSRWAKDGSEQGAAQVVADAAEMAWSSVAVHV